MIEVTFTTHEGKRELAFVRMANLANSHDPAYGDYSIEFGVDTAEGMALYQRSVYNFPRKEFNVLGLMKLALETLSEKELSLDADPDADAGRSPDLARRLPRTF